jgi:hypothetical protein
MQFIDRLIFSVIALSLLILAINSVQNVGADNIMPVKIVSIARQPGQPWESLP